LLRAPASCITCLSDGVDSEEKAVLLFTKAIQMKPSPSQCDTNDSVVSFKSMDSFSATPTSNSKLQLNTAIHHHSNNYMNTPTTCLEDALDDDPNDLLLDSCEGHDVAER